MIDRAVNALVAGQDSPSLRELAGAPPTDSSWQLRPLIEDCLEELGIDHPGPQVHDLQVSAARAMCRRLLASAVTARELVRWAHAVIGHDGAPGVQALVELDDLYDNGGEYLGQPPAATLEEVVHAEARALVAVARQHQ